MNLGQAARLWSARIVAPSRIIGISSRVSCSPALYLLQSRRAASTSSTPSDPTEPDIDSFINSDSSKGTAKKQRVRPHAMHDRNIEEEGNIISALRAQLALLPAEPNLTELEKQDDLIKRRGKYAKSGVKLKKLKPLSPGLRWYRAPIYPYLWKGKPLRRLTIAKRGKGGRNNSGHITCRHRGGGHKRRIRQVDFIRKEPGLCTVQRIEYDPGRTSHIALIKNEAGELSYITACEGLRAGDTVESFRSGIPQNLMDLMGGKIDPAIMSSRTSQKGNCLPLSMVPIGAIIHNIGAVKGGPAIFCRAAGAYGRLVSKLPDKNRAVVRLQSGEQRYVALEACGTIGVVSNPDHQHAMLGKAGRSRWRGIRPTVRGLAMNACDHPHGGGRGKSKGNRNSTSPWGTLAKTGFRTRRKGNNMKIKDRPRGKAAKIGK